ncbi:DNA polymerase Y family protein [Sphaerochaeta sp.]|uniref:DNA polymerase Y family protein n=1 Tax=Sphaerochaeta sp. TaxID=1972642 RepID=UPI003D0BECD0
MQRDRASIIHLNVTDFAAAVAVAKDSRLADKAFAIALEGSARRVILTPSRRAWEEGIRTGMPVALAERMLPTLRILPPDVPATTKAEEVITSIVQAYTPHFQCDRGGHVYLDMSGTTRLFGPAVDSAVRIRKEIRERIGLEGAVAVASNKLVAKIGTRTIRPYGLAQIREGEEASFLSSQDISLLSGVGQAISSLLRVAGITQIGQLAQLDDEQTLAFLGKKGVALRDAARGLDRSSLGPSLTKQKQIIRKVSFAEPILDHASLKAALVSAAEDAGLEMRGENHGCSHIHLTLLWSDGRSSEASRRTKDQWILDLEIERVLWDCALQAANRRVSLLAFTLRLSDLNPALGQSDLFIPTQLERSSSLQSAVDRVRTKFGPAILCHAAALCHAH